MLVSGLASSSHRIGLMIARRFWIKSSKRMSERRYQFGRPFQPGREAFVYMSSNASRASDSGHHGIWTEGQRIFWSCRQIDGAATSMIYDFIAIPDSEIPRAIEPVFQHVVTVYVSEANKTVSMWRAVPDELL